MDVRFPDIPSYRGWGKPLRVESTIDDVELIAGEVPRELAGTWYRAGPDRQYAPMTGEDIFIDGEGMAHMFRFKDGRVSYRSRWVRTARFVAQEKAGRSLFGRYRNRYTNDPSVEGMSMGAANTNAVFHAGKLMILKEDDLPYEVDPDTLATIGQHDYGGGVKAVSMSAHPKVDPVRDRMATFSYQAKGDGTTDIVFYEIDGDGRIVDEIWFDMPYPGMVHDFAITEHYAIFPFFPLITTMDSVKAGGTYYEWHRDRETMVAVVKRGGTREDIRWFRGAPTSAGHMLNAHEDGDGRIHLDLCLYEGNCFPFFKTPDGETTPTCPPILTRMTFDLTRNADDFTKAPIMPVPCEMPRTDDRYQGMAVRHGYMICYRTGDGTSAIGHLDLATNAFETWAPGARSSCQEPQFVPRTPDSPESDGWLLTIVNRLDENHSDLAILDAQKIADGPVALLSLPVRVRATFHGSWVPAETLATGHFAMSRAA